MANRYNTPSEGTVDWHNPLNENFELLDGDVEIRDVESNLNQYDPKADAKFLATDTGAVFLGDGSNWNQLGAIQDSQQSTTSDGSIVAAPGDVQNAIDEAASAGGGTVKLDPSQRYEQPSSPWVVKKQVVLDFNGAIMYAGPADKPNTDVIHLHPSAQVHNPKIDFWEDDSAYGGSNPYAGNVFTLDSGTYKADDGVGGYFADGTTIRGGWTQVVESPDATWIYMTAPEAYIALITIQTHLKRPNYRPSGQSADFTVGTGIHMDNTNTGNGFIAGNQFYGNWRGAKTTIRISGSNYNEGNWFKTQVQPEDNSDYIWRIDDGADSRNNLLEGVIWDLHSDKFPDGVAWYIGSEGSDSDIRKNGINSFSFYENPDYITNNSPHNHFITDPVSNQTTQI